MTALVQKRRFSMHPDIIFSVIHDQAGSLSKAVLEIAQNSVDSGSTRLTLKLNSTGFVAEDDGRGFTSRREIEEWFEVFGTPHKEGDARFGRFRMGRGQIFSYSANRWETGVFIMDVDVKNCGLDYTLAEAAAPVFDGCRISGRFYEPLSPSELAHTVRELADQLAYVEIPIVLNGKQINRCPAQEKWDVETDDVWVRFSRARGLRVYNMGVFVREYSADQFGCSGVVVSKHALRVNFARNDVISTCPRWKRIRTILKSHAKTESLNAMRMTEAGRQHLIRSLLSGDIGFMEIHDRRIITLANGTRVTPARLGRGRLPFTVADEDGSRVVDLVTTRGEAVVVSRRTLEEFEVDSLRELLNLLAALAERTDPDRFRWYVEWFRRAPIVEFSALSKSFSSDHVELADNELDKRESVLLTAIREGNRVLVPFLSAAAAGDEGVRERTIYVGVSDTADAWTDGCTRIVLNRALLAKGLEGIGGFHEIALSLVHEYVHDSADHGSHLHDGEFYERFHNLVFLPNNPVSVAAYRMYLRFLRGLEDRDIKVPAKLVRDQDCHFRHQQRFDRDSDDDRLSRPGRPVEVVLDRAAT